MGARPRPADADYEIVDRSGPDHAPSFVVEVAVETSRPARGEGTLAASAEQEAAATVLVRAKGVWRRTAMSD